VEERLATLGVGLLLHDVGKVAAPSGLLNKPDGLSAAEQALLDTHPEVGLALLQSDAISLVVKAIVRDHHERWDGAGFPRGVERDAINPLARIAAVADVYDNATGARPDRPGAPPHAGVAAVRNASGRRLDPEIVDVFRSMIFPYPVGTDVEVDGGIVGVVASVDPHRPDVPLVRFLGPDGPFEISIDTRRPAFKPRD
jgi:HD-GYP domain-containing protein (c-di-GMP phosphodiesterase class II)